MRAQPYVHAAGHGTTSQRPQFRACISFKCMPGGNTFVLSLDAHSLSGIEGEELELNSCAVESEAAAISADIAAAQASVLAPLFTARGFARCGPTPQQHALSLVSIICLHAFHACMLHRFKQKVHSGSLEVVQLQVHLYQTDDAVGVAASF